MIHSQLQRSLLPCFVANLNSFACDYCVRQKTSQPSLPMGPVYECVFVAPEAFHKNPSFILPQYTLSDWLLSRLLELTYTAWDLEAFAQECKWFGPPFRWDEERRFLLRCELDAAFFHLYLKADKEGHWQPARIAEGAVRDETTGEFSSLTAAFPTPRDAMAHIMDTFPIVRRKDEEKYNGDYRTKRVILEIYDAMQESIRTGRPYQTRLDPPPADPRCCHPPRKGS
jgi:hypothetical protein